jgi:pimeloyl-ACP methyl ester carboxylesterase
MPLHRHAEVNGVRLHYATEGAGPLLLFLHGFPEFWYAWRRQLAEFGRDHQAVAPDMRGYNLSSKPEGLEAYAMPHLVEDVAALASHLGHERFTLVAHDWGGVVAWTFAMAHPDRLARLIIVNAPHPGIFQRELTDNPAQQKASEYMLVFRSPEAERLIAEDDYRRFRERILDPLVAGGHLTEEDCRAYLEAWSRPGALTGGLNYYRAARLGPRSPRGGEAAAAAALPAVTVPTLVIWGERDEALLAGNLDGLERVVGDLTVRRIPEGTHWVVHEHPDLVNAHIREFLAATAGR